MNEPASVQQERARLTREWWLGLDEGYHDTGPLPKFWFEVPPGRMTARQQGYFYGRQMRQHIEDEPL